MNRPVGERQKVSVSLIIPTYKREELLVNTLRCALAQDRDDYEIIVVDQTPQHDPAT
ncbi:MAG: glycosyltransferase family 2 protein, partial [Gammaproteobacteria bacterium]